jgi:VCBS repeat-containing protein
MTTNYLRFSRKANLLKLFFIAVFTLFIGTERSSASHSAGGNLTYTHLAGNQYLVHFTYYRDCFGIPAPTSIIVYIESNACGIAQQQFTAPAIGAPVEITYPCSTSQTTCSNGTAPGIQRIDYEVTIALPGQCPDWRIWVTDCCRNQAITTLNGAAGLGIYIEARLNNSNTDNSSPQFAIDPILFVCTGANFAFNNGAIDPEGDSLVYSFIAPRTEANTNCAYNPGYSVLNPISSTPAVNIDPGTGDVSMFPTSIEVGVMVVLIYEYRNGELIGSVMRDIQIYTVACQNTAPTTGGIDNTGNFSLSACAGATICFDVPSFDPDAGDTLTMVYNGTGIPNATWNTTGVPFPTGHFCWTTTAGDARTAPYTFFVTIRDNNCPSNGVQIYSFNITVGGGLAAAMSSTPVLCNGGSTGTATVNITGGSQGPFTYLWTPGGDTNATATGLAAGTYSVQVSDPNGCQTTQSITVAEPTVLVAAVNNVVDASCGTLGSFDINASGGTPGYSYYTNTVPPSTDSLVSAGTGTYLVTVQDANGCQSTANVTINGGGSIQATETHTDVACNGDNNGTATVNVTGGNGTEVYTWTPNVSTTGSATGLPAGTYVVDVSNGTCSTQVTIIIIEPAALSATDNTVNVTCNGAADGSITLTVNGGTGAYSYAWTPNVSTGASAAALSGGNYSIVITDDNQCSTTVNVNVAEAPPIVLTTSSSPASCLLTNGSATVVASGGAGGFSYSWSNGETTSTISNIGTGSYPVDVMDANGCIESTIVNVSSTGVTAVVSSQTDATCEGGDDGAATVTASGGQAPYTYLWSPVGGTAATATGLAPGTYTVTVEDYLGCQAIVNVVIGFLNAAPVVDLGPDSVACAGNTVTLDAGAGMASYLWSDNSTNQTLDVTADGAYGVVVTDANGCQGSDMINVTFVQCLAPIVNQHGGTDFIVHPNPARDYLNIAISNVKHENVRMELSDILGNVLFTSTEKADIGYRATISVENLAVGVYLLKVQYAGEVKAIKVVKN